jgi:polysaccharide deacetylase family sporulation protein PdaB
MIFVLKKKKIILSVILTLVLVFSLIVLKHNGTHAVFYSKNIKKLPIYSVNTSEKKVAISFDCAWGTDYTQELLDIMEEKKIKSTFFMVEFWTNKHQDLVKKISDMGHEIGTHSATHPHMNSLSKESVIRELTSSVNAIERIINKKVRLFRPPFGEYNDTVITATEELFLYSIQWSVDSLDWKDLSKTEIENRVISRVKNGSIVLFHNQGKNTAKALPKIIDTLKGEGYTFVPIGELIYTENYYINSNGEQIKNS